MDGAALEPYSALLVPGRHAQQVDLPYGRAMVSVLLQCHERRLPTSTIRHGPAALLSTPFAEGRSRLEAMP